MLAIGVTVRDWMVRRLPGRKEPNYRVAVDRVISEYKDTQRRTLTSRKRAHSS